jgi:hypothetical protein
VITVGLWITVHDESVYVLRNCHAARKNIWKLTICCGFDRRALESFMKVYPNQPDDVSIMTLFDLT